MELNVFFSSSKIFPQIQSTQLYRWPDHNAMGPCTKIYPMRTFSTPSFELLRTSWHYSRNHSYHCKEIAVKINFPDNVMRDDLRDILAFDNGQLTRDWRKMQPNSVNADSHVNRRSAQCMKSIEPKKKCHIKQENQIPFLRLAGVNNFKIVTLSGT